MISTRNRAFAISTRAGVRLAVLALLLVRADPVSAAVVRDHTRIAHGVGGVSSLNSGIGFGGAIAALGDLDRDGVDDIAVTATGDPGIGTPANGAIYILFLRRDGTARSIRRITPASARLRTPYLDGARLGMAIEAVGDLDGDGNTEVAVSTLGPEEHGSVHVLFLDQTGGVRRAVEIPRSDPRFSGTFQFGESLAFLGDRDDDGFVELVIGDSRAPNGGVSRGWVWIVELDPDASVVDVHAFAPGSKGFGEPVADHTNFGSGLAVLGDLDDDGTVELAVGASYDDEGTDNTGSVWIVSLDRSFEVVAHRKIPATHAAFAAGVDYDDAIGHDVSRVDDLDGDGVCELAVSSGSNDGNGYDRGVVWIAFLARDATVRSIQQIGEQVGGLSTSLNDGEWFGSSVESIGDLDGDGLSELAVGSVGHHVPYESTGAIRILFLESAASSDTLETIGAREDGRPRSPTLDAYDRIIPLPHARSFREW